MHNFPFIHSLRSATHRISKWTLTFLIATAFYASIAPRVHAARPTDLFFSEYVEGSSNNKALEIFNGTGAPINLAANNYNVQIFFNGATTAGLTINLTGTVASDDVYVVAHSSANAAILAQADQTAGGGWFTGDDAVVLRKGTTIVDVIGQVGSDPGSAWGSGSVTTNDHTLRRKANVCGGDTNSTNAFDPSVEWDGFPNDTTAGLGSHTASCSSAPTVASTNPAAGSTNVAGNTNLTITFNKPVNATGIWLSIVGQTSGAHGATVSGGPVSYTLDPDRDFATGESVTVKVFAARVSDQEATPNNLAADFSFSFTAGTGGGGGGGIDPSCGTAATLIHAIQGNGTVSPLNNTPSVVIEGIVVGDYQEANQLRGFHVQEEDADADNDPTTSEGIFVFDNNAGTAVRLGDKVRVRGTVAEFPTGATSLTQLNNISSVIVCGSGQSVTPATVNLPVANLADWERFEGMLIRIPQTLTVTDTFSLGRRGEVGLSVGGRLSTPTNVVAPGATARTLQELNSRSRIVLDDADDRQNVDPIVYPAPGLSATNTLRLGFTVDNLTGVLEQRFGSYRIQPVGPIAFTAANPRPAAPDSVGGTLRVASFNVLNYFNGNGTGGGFPTTRGASLPQEFTRQRDKIISAITTIDPAIAGLIEIENDTGPNSAIVDLVNGLNAVSGAGTYSLIDTGVVGTDEIRVALIFKPSVVTPVGAFKILNASVDPQFRDDRNRPTLAQTFRQISNGAKFTVAVNHFKSKGSACNDDPDTNDGQGNCNVTRTRAATALVSWLATDPTGSGDPDFLIIGDLNAYAQENPITTIKTGGYTDLIQTFVGAKAYSFNFNGESGYLDHALASTSLRPQVTGAAEWHINSDEPVVLDYNVEFKSPSQVTSLYAPNPFRASDHDPLVVGLNLTASPNAKANPQITPKKSVD